MLQGYIPDVVLGNRAHQAVELLQGRYVLVEVKGHLPPPGGNSPDRLVQAVGKGLAQIGKVLRPPGNEAVLLAVIPNFPDSSGHGDVVDEEGGTVSAHAAPGTGRYRVDIAGADVGILGIHLQDQRTDALSPPSCFGDPGEQTVEGGVLQAVANHKNQQNADIYKINYRRN